MTNNGQIVLILTGAACILFHELGHWLMARLLGTRLTGIGWTPVGIHASIRWPEPDYKKQIAIHAAGPAANILLAVSSLTAAICTRDASGGWFFSLAWMNLWFAGFNLIPLQPFDGGWITSVLLQRYVGIMAGERVARRLSVLLAVLLVLSGGIQTYENPYNFSLLMIGSYALWRVFAGRGEVALMNMKQLAFRRSRLLKKEIYAARALVVMKCMRVSEVLKHLDFDRFHILYVLEEDLSISGLLTEQELIDQIVKGNSELTVGEVLEYKTSCKTIEK